jgi:hypothetical protein
MKFSADKIVIVSEAQAPQETMEPDLIQIQSKQKTNFDILNLDIMATAGC